MGALTLAPPVDVAALRPDCFTGRDGWEAVRSLPGFLPATCKSSYRLSTRTAFWHSTVKWSGDLTSARMLTGLILLRPVTAHHSRAKAPPWSPGAPGPGVARARLLRPSLTVGAGDVKLKRADENMSRTNVRT